jgi:carbon storage regulator CsrA
MEPMLVLSRKAGESVVAGTLTLKVLAVHGDQVRLGFEAPNDLRILRMELIGVNSGPIGSPGREPADNAARPEAAEDQRGCPIRGLTPAGSRLLPEAAT